VKSLATLVLALGTLIPVSCALSGCNRATQSKEAIRAGVIDYLAGKVNVGAMDVDVTSIDFKGSEADATVAFRAKGADPATGLQMRYTLEQKAGKWVVKDKAQAGGSPHGAAINPGGQPASPHGNAGGGDLPAGHPPLDPGEGKR
jgi:hypothetical protein